MELREAPAQRDQRSSSPRPPHQTPISASQPSSFALHSIRRTICPSYSEFQEIVFYVRLHCSPSQHTTPHLIPSSPNHTSNLKSQISTSSRLSIPQTPLSLLTQPQPQSNSNSNPRLTPCSHSSPSLSHAPLSLLSLNPINSSLTIPHESQDLAPASSKSGELEVSYFSGQGSLYF